MSKKSDHIVTWAYGRMKFEDGVRPVIMKHVQPAMYHAFFIDGAAVRRRYVLATEVSKYFTEWSSEMCQVKKVVRRFLGKNLLSRKPREITTPVRKALKEAL